MLLVQGHPLMACYAIRWSLPPVGCVGVAVRGFDLDGMGGITRIQNGTIQTPTVRLEGVWDGQVLTLAERPQSTTARGTEPAPTDETPPADVEAGVFERIQADMPHLRQRGVQILSFGVDADGVVDVLLTVADPTSVQALYSNYGRLHISGWLRPVVGP